MARRALHLNQSAARRAVVNFSCARMAAAPPKRNFGNWSTQPRQTPDARFVFSLSFVSLRNLTIFFVGSSSLHLRTDSVTLAKGMPNAVSSRGVDALDLRSLCFMMVSRASLALNWIDLSDPAKLFPLFFTVKSFRCL